jgi:hypothetical protein
MPSPHASPPRRKSAALALHGLALVDLRQDGPARAAGLLRESLDRLHRVLTEELARLDGTGGSGR